MPISCFEHLFYAKPKTTSPFYNRIQFTWKNERLILIEIRATNPIKQRTRPHKTRVEPAIIKIKEKHLETIQIDTKIPTFVDGRTKRPN